MELIHGFLRLVARRYRTRPFHSHWSHRAKGLLRPFSSAIVERMRTTALLLCSVLALAGLGCMKRVPAKKPPAPPAPAKVRMTNPRELGTPSALIDPPPEPATDKMPFDLPLGKGYGLEGSWTGPSWDQGMGMFERRGSFTVKKSDNSDVDPAEIDTLLEKWILASGVQSTQSSRMGTYGRAIGYGTEKTVGNITYTVLPESPAKSVSFHVDIHEKLRQPR